MKKSNNTIAKYATKILVDLMFSNSILRLFMRAFSTFVISVTTRQVKRDTFEFTSSLCMRESNILVIDVTTRPWLDKTWRCTLMLSTRRFSTIVTSVLSKRQKRIVWRYTHCLCTREWGTLAVSVIIRLLIKVICWTMFDLNMRVLCILVTSATLLLLPRTI